MSTRKCDSAMSTEDFLRKVVFGSTGNQDVQERTLLEGAGERNSARYSAVGDRWGHSGAPAGRGGVPASATNNFQVRVQTSPQGKIARKQEHTPGGSVQYQYAYDAEGRLARVAREGRLVEDYTYNAAGQRIAARSVFKGRIRARSFAYNEKGQLVTVREDAGGVQDGAAVRGVTRHFYDGRGSLRVIEDNGQTTVFSYGNDARLDTAELPDGRIINYVYGPRLMPEKVYCNRELVLKYHWLDDFTLGSCFDAQSGFEYTFHHGPHDGGQGEGSPANTRRRAPNAVTIRGEGLASLRLTPTQRFGYAGSGIPQGREDEFLPDVSCLTEDGGGLCLTLAIGADQVGSIRTLCDRSGNIIKEITYDSFGNVLTETRPRFALPLGFACGLNDPFTGFVRFGHRDYDPGVGRFTALDPARDRRGDGDLYDYCADDPVNRVDPAGLEFTEAQARAGGASHAGISHPFGAKHSEVADGAKGYDPKHWPGAQAWEEATRRSRQWQEARKIVEKHSWNMENALNHLRTHALKKSENKCATYVRQAIEAGGIRLGRSESAHGYGPSLGAAGFVAMPPGTEPQAGDVAIFPAIEGHKHGHMTMFTGTTWYSDFPQRDIYAGRDYRESKAKYTIYRRPKADDGGL